MSGSPDDDVDIDRLFEPDQRAALQAYLHLLHPTDVAELFSLVKPESWTLITRELSAEQLAEVLTHLDEGQLEELGERLHTDRLIQAMDELETDDAADILAELPDEKTAEVLQALVDKEEIASLLKYPEDTAGGIMQTELCAVREGERVSGAIEAVRRAREEIEDILDVYVVDPRGRLRGIVALEDLVLSPDRRPLAEICRPVPVQVTADLDQEEVAALFRKYDMAAIPVVDEGGVLLGRITFDDVHDVLEEEASEDIMVMAGASTEDLVYGGDFFRIAAFRLPWLLSSLVGSLITSQIVPLFSNVPADTIILTAFVPVVAAMTGNMGSQTAMIITRGFAIGKVELGNLMRTFLREIRVGAIMGTAAGLVVGSFARVVYGDFRLGLALGLSVLSSMTAAAFVGAAAPVGFKRLGMDPAIGAGPFVTTGGDMLGVSVYLGVALLVLS